MSAGRGVAWVPAVVVVVAAGVLGTVLLVRDDGGSGDAEPEALAVDAESVYQFASLEEMVDAGDAVVVGTVTSVERGRLVGEPDDGGVVSRTVAIDVDEVLAGDAGTTILMEEEGWLPDGTPLIVNGVAPSEAGDHGMYFLDAVADPERPFYVVINSQGRFLADGEGTLTGGDQRDVLVQELQHLTLDELAAAVRDE